jgi:Mg2+ and Co2+ transporter CorA
MDHMNKILDTLDEYTEVIEVFKDADYLHSGIRTNRMIRSLGVLFMIGVPFLLVAAIYLMLPAGVNKTSGAAFAVMVAIIAVLVGAILLIFRRRHLI